MITDVYDFDYSIISKAENVKRKKGSRNKKNYKNLVCAFDIETTRIKEIEQAVMYIWQFQVDENCTVIGRTWDEFRYFMQQITEYLNDMEYIVVYVHNLSFEFQFLSGIYPFSKEEVFALDKRKVCKCEMFEHFEFRCSYIQTNMSLQIFTDKMNVKHKKLSGDLDYNIERYSYTQLTDEELAYCINDVQGLVEAIKTEMKNDGDTLYTIPLTSTGYVRRDVKNALEGNRWIMGIQPDFEVYQVAREAFRGGNTHANRFYAGWILEGVHSADRSSSYPGVQCNRAYPVTRFHKISKPVPDAGQIIDMMKRREKAILLRVSFKGLSLNDYSWGCPYLAKDKCRTIINGVFDNGRVLSADYLETSITDVDLRIIVEEYHIEEIVPIEVYTARYGKLPAAMIETICLYYKKKTELKDVEGQEYFYMKSKNKLNSIYGMTAQDPVKESILYEDDEFTIDTSKTKKELLEEFMKRAFIPYTWGVWCTAWARYELESGMRIVTDQGGTFIYCDTDSIKYLGDVDFSTYNNEKIKLSKQNGAWVTDQQGKEHFMEVYEQEKDAERFITWGAKKYAYESDGKLKITVAGVPKKAGAEELKRKGGLDALKPGFVFSDCGKLETVYNDKPEITKYKNKDGKTIEITKNVVLRPTTYAVGITKEYEEILQDALLYNQSVKILKGTNLLA